MLSSAFLPMVRSELRPHPTKLQSLTKRCPPACNHKGDREGGPDRGIGDGLEEWCGLNYDHTLQSLTKRCPPACNHKGDREGGPYRGGIGDGLSNRNEYYLSIFRKNGAVALRWMALPESSLWATSTLRAEQASGSIQRRTCPWRGSCTARIGAGRFLWRLHRPRRAR